MSADARERGIALMQMGRPAEAETAFREALVDDPDDADVLAMLAWTLLQQDRDEEAVAAARQSVVADPESDLGFGALAAALAATDNEPGALAAIGEAIRRDPFDSTYRWLQAALLHDAGRLDEALHAILEARELDPEDADAAALQARILTRLGRGDEAKAVAAEALALDPENELAYQGAGLVALRQGRSRDAVEHYREALRLDPTDDELRAGLEVALKSRNPAYAALYRFGVWMEGLPGGWRWAVRVAPLLSIRAAAFSDAGSRPYLVGVVVVVATLTWLVEPLTNLALFTTSSGRRVMHRKARLAAIGLAVLGAATVAVFVATVLGARVAGVAVGWLCLALAFGMLHDLNDGLARALQAAVAVGVATGIAAIAFAATHQLLSADVWQVASRVQVVTAFTGIAALLLVLWAR